MIQFHRIAIGHVNEEHLKGSLQHMVKYGLLKVSTEKESSFWTCLVAEIRQALEERVAVCMIKLFLHVHDMLIYCFFLIKIRIAIWKFLLIRLALPFRISVV